MMMVGWVLYLVGMVLLYLLARGDVDQSGGDDERVHVPVLQPAFGSRDIGGVVGLMSVLFLVTAYAVFKAEKWQAAGSVGAWVYGALAVSALAVGLGTLTRYAFASVLVPLLIYVGVSFPETVAGEMRAVSVGVVLVLAPWARGTGRCRGRCLG